MGITKKNIAFSKKHKDLSILLEAGLKKVSQKLIAETKQKHGYLIITDKKGEIKKVSAKDL